MKFTLAWLKTHLITDATLAEITDRLTGIGLELEGIEDKARLLAPFVVAHVIEAVQHPNADRLRVCTVDIGGKNTVSVVCGAPNARTGMKAVFAPPGAYIPGSDVTLKVGEIRGVQSAGMLLSTREMGLGDDHSGIVDLPEDAPVGMSYVKWKGIGDPIIEIAVTPNRGDALSIRGIARDLAAAGIGTLVPWSPTPVAAHFKSRLHWQIDSPTCPFVLGRHFRNLRNGLSPAWLADRLTAIGLRPINALVDITNFFTFDIGRPLHVFDAGKLQGDTLTLRPGRDESFRALDGRDYVCTSQDCVIADAAGVQSLAGVMGGAASGCDETTTEMFLECALFDPIAVALTGRRHALTSDARQRFERGIDPALLPDAIEAACAMVLDLCGGEASDIVAAGTEPAWQRDATLRFSRLRSLGGVDVAPDEAVGALERLGFTVRHRDADAVTVAVPSWRNDVAAGGAPDLSATLSPDRAATVAVGAAVMEPEADLVEEVLRLRGLDTIEPVSLPRASAVPGATLTPRQARTALARRTLAAQGMAECVTFSFMASADAARFGGGSEALRLVNPIAADLDQLRPTPLATLALAAQRNVARGFADAALFEIGPAFSAADAGGQAQMAAALRRGHTPRHWLAASRPCDVMDAKADAIAVLTALGVPMDSVTAADGAPGYYHPGRSGVLRQGPKTMLAQFGELHPAVLAGIDLPGPVVGCEIFLAALSDPKQRRRGAPDLSPFQPIFRDFAFLVAETVSAESLLRAARGAERTLITGVSLFDVFTGPTLPAGQKSIGLEVIFQPRERTLTDAEIAVACEQVIAAVARATGATLRG